MVFVVPNSTDRRGRVATNTPPKPPTAQEWLEALGMGSSDEEDDDDDDDDNPFLGKVRQPNLKVLKDEVEHKLLVEHEKGTRDPEKCTRDPEKGESRGKCLDISACTSTSSSAPQEKLLLKVDPQQQQKHQDMGQADMTAIISSVDSQKLQKQSSPRANYDDDDDDSIDVPSPRPPVDPLAPFLSEIAAGVQPLPTSPPIMVRGMRNRSGHSLPGAFDESEAGESTHRSKISFSLFGNSSHNNLSFSLRGGGSDHMTAKVERSDRNMKGDDDSDDSDQSESLVKAYAAVTVVFVVIIVVAVVLVVVLSQPSQEGAEDMVLATTGLVSREEGIAMLTSSLDAATQDLIHQDRTSPQALAFDWVTQDPSFDQMMPWRHLQRFALATIYFSTRGPLWPQPHSWLHYDIPECEWEQPPPTTTKHQQQQATDSSIPAAQSVWQRSHCNNDGSYARLHLDDIDNFGGSMPSEIEFLTGLEELHIINMPFKLSLPILLPQQLQQLTRLHTLDLSGSNLESSFLPTLIGSFKSLQSLRISNTDLAGTLPSQIGNLGKLHALDLSMNQLGGSLPKEWSQLSNLIVLRIQSNNLIGTLPPEWGVLDSLQEADISDNQFTGTVPLGWGWGMDGLDVLRMHHNHDLEGEGFFCEHRHPGVFLIFQDCEQLKCMCTKLSCHCVAPSEVP